MHEIGLEHGLVEQEMEVNDLIGIHGEHGGWLRNPVEGDLQEVYGITYVYHKYVWYKLKDAMNFQFEIEE